MSAPAIAWIVFGGLIVLGILILLLREIPSMVRELKIMNM
jgi:hypothetical protein